MSAQAWIIQAESDLAAARVLEASAHHSQAIWLAAQAVEKALKGLIAALGLQYEESDFKKLNHNTSAIQARLPAALQEPIDPNVALKIATLEKRSIGSRYPAPSPALSSSRAPVLVAPAISMTSSFADVSDAAFLLEWCHQRIVRAERAVIAMKPTP